MNHRPHSQRKTKMNLFIILVVAFSMMNDVNIEAFSLIPSQVYSSGPLKKQGVRRKKTAVSKRHTTNARTRLLVPSQVLSSTFPSSLFLAAQVTDISESLNQTTISTQESTSVSADTAVAVLQNNHSKDSRRSRRRKRPVKKKATLSTAAAGAAANGQVRIYDQFSTTGNLPDPWYRAIPMEHLRQHPRFHSLPPTVSELSTLEDVSRFRQESHQWDMLHTGRCTTSQAAAALGFLDPTPAQVLNIPQAWRKGARGAYQRLSQTPVLRTLDQMRKALLDPTIPPLQDEVISTPRNVWQQTDEEDKGEKVAVAEALAEESNSIPKVTFAATYTYEPTPQEFKERRKYIKERAGGDFLPTGIRLIWGNTQEATAVLTALNYFARDDPLFGVKETGMCGAGLALNQTNIQSSLLVGATPDAILCHGDGRIEVLEVKNHCPFFSNGNRRRHGGKLKNFSIGDRPFGNDGVLSQYVPQLQLEMYCLGPSCQSAVMVRQTATQGAVLLRMTRDDEWIDEMIYFLHKFQREHVEAQVPPKPDFFWDGTEASRYRRFVHKTIQVRDQVKVIANLTNGEIQRGSALAPFFLD